MEACLILSLILGRVEESKIWDTLTLTTICICKLYFDEGSSWFDQDGCGSNDEVRGSDATFLAKYGRLRVCIRLGSHKVCWSFHVEEYCTRLLCGRHRLRRLDTMFEAWEGHDLHEHLVLRNLCHVKLLRWLRPMHFKAMIIPHLVLGVVLLTDTQSRSLLS